MYSSPWKFIISAIIFLWALNAYSCNQKIFSLIKKECPSPKEKRIIRAFYNKGTGFPFMTESLPHNMNDMDFQICALAIIQKTKITKITHKECEYIFYQEEK